MQLRTHGSQGTAGESVGDVGFDPAAGFDVALVILDGEKKKHALIGGLAADAPFAKQIEREIADRLIVYRVDGDERELNAELLLDPGAECFELFLIGRAHDVGEIANVAGWLWQRVDVYGSEGD